MRQWEIDDKLIWKQAGIDQAVFVRDVLAGGLLGGIPCFAVSQHRSKSVVLPVYGFTMKNGIKIITRYNFYDWKVSVELPRPLPKNYLPTEIFSNDGDIPDCYLEGFKDEWSYKNYDPESETQTKFTVEISHKYKMYLLCFFLKNAFPEVEFDVDSDHRTVEEIKASIDKIHDENGYNDFRDDDGWGKPVKRRVLSGFEILWRTYHKIDSIRDEARGITDYNSMHDYLEKNYYEGYEHPNSERFLVLDIPDDSALFARIINGEPEVKKEFLREEWLYNQKY